jgi:hypothetical protein
MTEPSSGIEAQVGDKKVRVWGENFFVLMQTLFMAIVAVGLYTHDSVAGEKTKDLTVAIREQTKVLKEQLDAQREANCLNRLTTDQKKQSREIEFCQSLGKGR